MQGMNDTVPATGTHILIDHFGGKGLTDPDQIERALQEAAMAAGATILSGSFHKFGGHGGVTGVLLLAESHISIHTWPEKGYAAIDVFMCGTARPELAAASLKTSLRPERAEITQIRRGLTEPIIPAI